MKRIKQMITPDQCPVDFVTINENQVRFTAGWVFLSTALYLLTGYWWIILFLLIDFTLRAVNRGQFSPLNLLSGLAVKILSVSYQPTDRAPKRFAAKIGMVLSFIALGLLWAGYSNFAFFLFILLMLFSFLESVFAFCAGCLLYALIRKLSRQ
ncbi:hypothetical protein TH53_04760 [Pedobacter lusitanus]|uniref:DUF4395 domain-containing protein n=1 Tax=Pedobacter lusitanus TaxID=1503925 RepID=A0A0D0G0K8_9SPHI|nr:DUF4395 domain-containing protein [Pedobacter lusitanus]KIO78319.1 hypothetical protein TH53_04760 [Pedobacter lusitanus]